MRRFHFFLLVFTCAKLVCAQAVYPEPGPTAWSEPENLRYTIDRLMRYHDGGEYDRDIRLVTSSAREYLFQRVRQQSHHERLAAVFDIDETALSNWEMLADCGFCSYRAQTRFYPRPSHDPPIVPVRDLFDFAKQQAVAVFFVTGRTEDQRGITIANLNCAGYKNWNGLLMQRPDNRESAAVFKRRARRQIELMGFTIVLNIGDQASDLVGCCAERVFKLPNPFYLIE
jgi:predicted secreted acid phosphatase